MHVLLATSWIDPIVNAIAAIINAINVVVHNRGWSLVIFALGFKLLFWPLNTKQFKSMLAMQKIAPQLKKLQQKYGKEDPQRYQRETMELYKSAGANPFAGCWPMLVQYPVILSVYWAVLEHRNLYTDQHWLWIGQPFTAHMPLVWKVPLLAPNLGTGDFVLLLLYGISMYFFSRYATMTSPDPQQANTQKMMAIFSPLMLGYMGLQWNWPSAMVLYWFSYNMFTMGQQFYLLKKHHQPLSAIDSEHAVTEGVVLEPKRKRANQNALPAEESPRKVSSQRKKGAKR